MDIVVGPFSHALFTLQANQDATVSIGSTKGGVSIYFQYNTHGFEEISGLVNYIYNGNTQGHYHFSNG